MPCKKLKQVDQIDLYNVLCLTIQWDICIFDN